MNFRGRLWVPDDGPASAIEATVNVEGGELSISSRTEALGSWRLADVGVVRAGDQDFRFTIDSDQIIFRPTSEERSSFARELGLPGDLAGKIRAVASSPPPALEKQPAVGRATQDKTLRERWAEAPFVGKAAVVLVALLIFVAVVTSGGDDEPIIAGDKTTTTSRAATTTTRATRTTTTTRATTTAPPTTQSQFTRSEENAIASARSYLDFAAFSRKGLIEQLEFEGFSTADATLAVDYLNVDWFEQAWLSAEAYLDFTAFSRSGLIDQLIFEGFTMEQATYGVDKTGL